MTQPPKGIGPASGGDEPWRVDRETQWRSFFYSGWEAAGRSMDEDEAEVACEKAVQTTYALAAAPSVADQATPPQPSDGRILDPIPSVPQPPPGVEEAAWDLIGAVERTTPHFSVKDAAQALRTALSGKGGEGPLAKYEREMREEVIPEIQREEEEQRLAVGRLRLGLTEEGRS